MPRFLIVCLSSVADRSLSNSREICGNRCSAALGSAQLWRRWLLYHPPHRLRIVFSLAPPPSLNTAVPATMRATINLCNAHYRLRSGQRKAASAATVDPGRAHIYCSTPTSSIHNYLRCTPSLRSSFIPQITHTPSEGNPLTVCSIKVKDSPASFPGNTRNHKPQEALSPRFFPFPS